MTPIDELRQTMARLRAPDGCPWDQEQTHQTLARCLIDECSELLDTIDRNDIPHMREELGDVLIQVVFHAQLAAERGDFTFDDVAREINEKLIRRHPHVFGDHGKLDTAGEVITKWEQIKATEKKNGPAQSGVFKELPPRLPALMFAEAVIKQIEKKSLPAEGVIDLPAIAQTAAGLDEIAAGRRLFELAAACRQAGIDPEMALRKECDRVMRVVETKVGAVAAKRL
ncbi:MAG: Nucleoside triphosphate pyrophosphohydrolase/pyrophosphatase MazG [Verrucomicrobiota bacterium]|jgi:XTP/dITP diphosphohydrolase/tetrapyrrole methylase family protein/MazG family protein